MLTVLLLIVSVVSAIAFQQWYTMYSEELSVEAERTSSFEGSLRIDDMSSDGYLYINSPGDITLNRVSLNGYECGDLSNKNLEEGLNSFRINESCLDSVDSSIFEVLIETDDFIDSKTVYYEGVESVYDISETNGERMVMILQLLFHVRMDMFL